MTLSGGIISGARGRPAPTQQIERVAHAESGDFRGNVRKSAVARAGCQIKMQPRDILGDETIQKAQQFTDEWNKSSATWSLTLKAAISGMLPFFDDLLERATQFIKSLDQAKIEKAAKEQLGSCAVAKKGA